MAFGWAGAAAGAANANQQRQQAAMELQQQLADIAYRNALIEQQQAEGQRAQERLAFDKDKFARDSQQAEMDRSQQRNQVGVNQMLSDAYMQGRPPSREQLIGTLMSSGQSVPTGMLVAPERNPVQVNTVNDAGEPVIKFVEPEAGQEFAARPSAAAGSPNIGSFEDYVTAKFGDRPTPDQIEQARKRYNQADDRAPAGSGGGPRRNVTSGDANRMAELDSSLRDLDVLEKEIGTTGTAAAIGAWIPKPITDATGIGVDAKQRQGQIDRVKQVIGKALEGGVLRREDEYKYTKILPTIGDRPEVAKSKLNGLREALNQRREIQMDALEDAGYDVSRYRARQPTGGGGGGGTLRWDAAKKQWVK